MKILIPVVAAFTLCSCSWFKKKALLAPTVPPAFSVVQDRRLDEISGIAVSPDQPGVLFVHNDSGDSSRFFAIGPDGALKAIFHFQGEPTSRLGVRDVEDIAIGPGPDSGVNYIYLGDIGDNFAERGFVTVYRIKEPVVPGAARSLAAGSAAAGGSAAVLGSSGPTSGDVPHFEVAAEPLYLTYPDGARDAETLMVDPLLRQLYIVSKREDSVHVYSTPLDFDPRATRTLVRNAKLHFPGLDRWITAGDISQKGDQILIKSYTGVFYWRRRLSRADSTTGPEPVWMALQRPYTLQPYEPERQGEAIGFSTNGSGFYTISEGRRPKLYYYPLKGK